MLTTHEDTAMSDCSTSHKRHYEYTYRLPTPPRIVVPPPTLSADIPELSVGRVADTPDGEVDTSFLKEQNLESVVQKNMLLEWSYERRRQAQMILPWLYLGPLTAAKDKEFLVRECITMTLAIRPRETSMNGALHVGKELDLETGTIEASNYFTLISNFSRATKMINRHMAKVRQLTAAGGSPRMGKVLVFCESGNEKSAATVAAYLMETLDDFDHVKSMQVCQAQRFCVNFDDTVKNILRSHWDILTARRAVASSRVGILRSTPLPSSLQSVEPLLNSPNNSTSRQKRTIEDIIDDDDMEMDDGMDPSDKLRFSGRDITPFQDSR
ncbi:hypothetical protein K469DRAFT_567919 [Zopfia rhizophila CBS 207.26]|uniref:Uncharacterized protein n=1 Tax=Zopfia rhizophila CBS 207.26 TaxID=1314779 RepID=A0A6A6E7N3_9PEZI|nr:hypothetical protein K469DRAFT_567919 [Zopfia rhizophila CBS 207.26]